MLHVLGAGGAYPSNKIDNAFLASQNSELSEDWILSNTGIETRYSVLPLDLIESSSNKDPWTSFEELTETPTDLAVAAAHLALERAQVSPDQVGLIIGQCATPLQVTPSEAQRVGDRLNLKIPAYDVQGGGSAFALHLDMLCSWKEERIPEYVLCISAGTPTQHVDYSTGFEGAYFGDAAVAIVVSTQHKGKLKVVDTSYKTQLSSPDIVELGFYQKALLKRDILEAVFAEEAAGLLAYVAEKNSLKIEDIVFVGPQSSALLLESACERAGVSADNHWSNVKQVGFTLGASQVCVLADRWETLPSNQNIAFIHAGIGMGQAYVLLRT